MTDSTALKNKISESGFTITSLAKEMGMTRQGLSKKIHNGSSFWVDEMDIIGKKLKLSRKEQAKIFFACDVDKLTT